MGTTWVEDPSWGNIFSNFTKQMNAAPGEALSNIAQVEAIKTAREKRARETEQWNAGVKASGALDAAVPQAYVPPTDYTAPGPMIGDVNNPADTAGIPSVDLQYTDPRAQAMAEARRKLAIAGGQATILKDPSQWAPQLGYGSVAAAGVPATAAEKAQTQFLTTGKFPTAEEAKIPAAHNLAVIGADGQPTGRSILSQDFKRDINGQPFNLKPGETVLATGPASTTPANPFGTGTDAVALQSLDKIQKDSAARGHMTEEEAQLAGKLFDVAYPPSRVTETEGGRLVEKEIRAKPIPPSMMPMFQLTQDYARGAHLQPPQRPGEPPPVQPLTLENAPPPPPPVDPNATRVIGRGPANAAELRKEYQNVRAVDDWAITAPLFNSAIKSAQHPNNQGDINIMYAFAKLMDPGSVVRDSEGKLVMKSGTIDESIVGTFNALVRGTGTMTPEVRIKLIDTLKNRLEEIKGAKDIADKFYREQVAPEAGLKPEQIIIPAVEPIPYTHEQILGAGGGGSTVRQSQQPRSVDDIINGR